MAMFDIRDSENIKIVDSHSYGDPEFARISNVKGFSSENVSATGNSALMLLKKFHNAIAVSGLSNEEKTQLYTDSLQYLAMEGTARESKVKSQGKIILTRVGSAAYDFFIQLAANVTAEIIKSQLK